MTGLCTLSLAHSSGARACAEGEHESRQPEVPSECVRPARGLGNRTERPGRGEERVSPEPFFPSFPRSGDGKREACTLSPSSPFLRARSGPVCDRVDLGLVRAPAAACVHRSCTVRWTGGFIYNKNPRDSSSHGLRTVERTVDKSLMNNKDNDLEKRPNGAPNAVRDRSQTVRFPFAPSFALPARPWYNCHTHQHFCNTVRHL